MSGKPNPDGYSDVKSVRLVDHEGASIGYVFVVKCRTCYEERASETEATMMGWELAHIEMHLKERDEATLTDLASLVHLFG